jgi:outer membrane protein TolC
VDAALAANTDLRVARAHVEAARALASVAEAALYPTIAAQGAGWGNAGDTGIDGTAGSVLSPFTRGATGGGYLVGLGAQWEPDIFGGRHADVAAAQAMAGGVDWMAQGVRLMVVADVVENYQQWRGLEARLALLDQSLEATRALTTYVAARQGTGQASKPDLTRAQAAAASLEATRPQLLA